MSRHRGLLGKALLVLFLGLLSRAGSGAEPAAAAAAAPAATPKGPSPVFVGVFINRVTAVSLKENRFTVDFYLWFRWKDDELKPIETFEVVNGKVESKNGVQVRKSGDYNYAQARVEASISKFWDIARFPLDNHVATLEIEDNEFDETRIKYVADAVNSALNTAVQIPGWDIAGSRADVFSHRYATNYGDITLPTGAESTWARFVYSIDMKRTGFGYFTKLFFGLFVAVLISFLAFFIKPTDLDPRFGLGIGAIFAAVGSLYITTSNLPDTNIMTLADKLHILAFVFIFLSLLESTVSLRIHADGNEELARKVDIRSFVFLFAIYLAATIIITIRS